MYPKNILHLLRVVHVVVVFGGGFDANNNYEFFSLFLLDHKLINQYFGINHLPFFFAPPFFPYFLYYKQYLLILLRLCWFLTFFSLLLRWLSYFSCWLCYNSSRLFDWWGWDWWVNKLYISFAYFSWFEFVSIDVFERCPVIGSIF